MKKVISKIFTAVVAIVMASSLSSCNYNSLVEKQQDTDKAWAQVENQYQRRADLIPNLVNTVKVIQHMKARPFRKRPRHVPKQHRLLSTLKTLMSRHSNASSRLRVSSRRLSADSWPSPKLIPT